MELCINNKDDIIFDEPSALILPMSPSIYEKIALEKYDKDIFKINSVLHERFTVTQKNVIMSGNDDTQSDESIRSMYRTLFDYVTHSTILRNEELLVAYRNIGFITLEPILYYDEECLST